MEIGPMDIFGLLIAGVLSPAIVIVPLFIFYGIRAILRRPKAQKCIVATEKEMERWTQLKYRYETTEELYR